jgi:hypothetical protein
VRFSFKYFVVGMSFIALTVPAWAGTEHTQALHLQQDTIVGKTQIPAGLYEIKANEDKPDLRIVAKDGRVVLDAPGQWVKLPAKAPDSEVTLDGNHLVQVEFRGQNEAFHIS